MSDPLSPSRLWMLPAAFLCLLALPARTEAWGREGHHLVARLAAPLLTPPAKATVVELLRADVRQNPDDYRQTCEQVYRLGQKKDLTAAEADTFLSGGLVCVSAWADIVRAERRETSGWHFIDIPTSSREAELARDCGPQGCVVTALRLSIDLLSGKTSFESAAAGKNIQNRAEALKFLVHLVADAHQPLHCATDPQFIDANGRRGDRGGNLRLINFRRLRVVRRLELEGLISVYYGEAPERAPFGSAPNLHSFWDSTILQVAISQNGDDELLYYGKLREKLPADSRPENGVPDLNDIMTWVNESHRLALTAAYGPLPPPRTMTVPDLNRIPTRASVYFLRNDYLNQSQPVAEAQLRVAAVRLARTLNSIFGN